ncbi:MAG: hypothetical protein IJ421_00195 [Prevotella sp.]|nr:hypothetical protein [Prevotella sp.]
MRTNNPDNNGGTATHPTRLNFRRDAGLAQVLSHYLNTHRKDARVSGVYWDGISSG